MQPGMATRAHLRPHHPERFRLKGHDGLRARGGGRVSYGSWSRVSSAGLAYGGSSKGRARVQGHLGLAYSGSSKGKRALGA